MYIYTANHQRFTQYYKVYTANHQRFALFSKVLTDNHQRFAQNYKVLTSNHQRFALYSKVLTSNHQRFTLYYKLHTALYPFLGCWLSTENVLYYFYMRLWVITDKKKHIYYQHTMYILSHRVDIHSIYIIQYSISATFFYENILSAVL